MFLFVCLQHKEYFNLLFVLLAEWFNRLLLTWRTCLTCWQRTQRLVVLLMSFVIDKQWAHSQPSVCFSTDLIWRWVLICHMVYCLWLWLSVFKTNIHTHARTHARTCAHAHTHTHTHIQCLAHVHTHTHTHTHTHATPPLSAPTPRLPPQPQLPHTCTISACWRHRVDFETWQRMFLVHRIHESLLFLLVRCFSSLYFKFLVTDLIIVIIISLIYIAQFNTNGILTALYIVITYIQMQYVHVCTYACKYTYTCLHIHTYTVTCTNIHLPTY